jgi:hypothetical protein
VIRLSKEARRWPVGVARKPLQAKAFYATILAAIVIGAIANVLTISPMRALVWIAVINGIVAVPVMTLLMLPIQGAFAGARARQIRQGVAQRSLQSKLGRRKPDRLGNRVWSVEDRVIRLSM